MDLSNLRPADGSKHSDNFRRGRGHGSGNGKTAGKGHKGHTEAEKELKRKTGQVKRAMVWDWLVERFPIITLFITEEKYDELLDEALEKFKKMLESNSSLYDYVYNTVTVSDEDTEDDILRKITEGA